MSIPNFKSNHDWEAFTQIFDSQWHCKRALLNRVKNDLFPEYKSWDQLQPQTLEVINDIVSNLVYECNVSSKRHTRTIRLRMMNSSFLIVLSKRM